MLQKGCFVADVLLFGRLRVACGFGCLCMGQMGSQKVCFELVSLALVRLYGANELQKGNIPPRLLQACDHPSSGGF